MNDPKSTTPDILAETLRLANLFHLAINGTKPYPTKRAK